MPSAPTHAADDDEHHPRDDDRVRRGLDPDEHQRPRRAEVGDRRVRHRVGADRDPAGDPSVRPAHQPAAPLVGAAGDGELRRQLGVHREQQALARERHRQHPDPRRPGDHRADEHDRVQPDDRRDRGEAERDVVEAAAAGARAPAGTRARPAARRPGRRGAATAVTRRAPGARARPRGRPRPARTTPSFTKMLRRCDSTVFSLRKSSPAISRLVLRSVTRSAISQLALGQRRARRRPRRSRARASPPAPRACAARGASRRARGPSRSASSSLSAARSVAIAPRPLAGGGQRLPEQRRAQNAAGSRAPMAAAPSADSRGRPAAAAALPVGEQQRRAAAPGERRGQLQAAAPRRAPRRART